MPWKSQYLANLLRVSAADGIETNREFLALLEAEKKIRARIDDYLAARSRAGHDGRLKHHKNPLLSRRHLLDLYTMALIDKEVSDSEQRLIDDYVKESEIPTLVAARIRKEAEAHVKALIAATLAKYK